MPTDDKEGRERHGSSHTESTKLQTATVKSWGGLTEKRKPSDARQDYFDHLWHSGSQDSTRQEPYREFCSQVIYSFTVDHFGLS